MNFIESEENRDILRHRILNSAKLYLNNPKTILFLKMIEFLHKK